MNGVAAHPVTFLAHGISEEGHGVLVFESRSGRRLPLAIHPEQLQALLVAVAHICQQTQKTLGFHAATVSSALPLESWSTALEGEDGLLTLRVQGAEIQFRVTPDTRKIEQNG